MTQFTKHAFPGLPNPVYLPDWITVQQKIIPNGTWGWTSGQKIPAKNFTSTTWHDTGNSRTGAQGEYTWARDGGRGEMGSAGSYNGIFQSKLVILTQFFNELVGHAANHQGNITSYAFEQSGWGPGFDFEGSWDTGMWLHAGVLQAMGRNADTSMYQHNAWSGKNCPGEIRRRGLWSATEKGVDDRIAQINAYLAGGVPGPDPTPKPIVYPKPDLIPVLDAIVQAGGVAPAYAVIPNDEKTTAFYVGDRYQAIRDTPRLLHGYPSSEVIGPVIKGPSGSTPGESFNIDFVFQNQYGKWGYTPYGTRVNLDDLVRISDQKAA